MIFVVSDTHFNHTNIIKYCNRPTNWQDIFIDHCQRLIDPRNDVLLHLGDFRFGSVGVLSAIRALIPCRIFMVLGNHDKHQDRLVVEIYIYGGGMICEAS